MLSAVILTRNEERNIVDCIETVAFCDEIIIIDDYSEDRTLEVIKTTFPDKNIKIFKRNLALNFAKQRNYGLSKASGDWVLFIDADERVSKPLAGEILGITSSQISQPSNLRGFYIKRRDIMWGKELKHGEVGNIKLLRLARKDGGKWVEKVHETWQIPGPAGELEEAIFHYPHPTIAEFLREINFYTSLRAEELFASGVKVHWWSIILYPKAKFFVNFFLKRGFLDGMPGFIFALMMSFHSFLVRAKLWQLWKQ